jgi:peptidase E
MIVFPEFEMELKSIDPRLTVVINPNYPQLANIKIEGRDVCPIPSAEIKDELDRNYTIQFPNGFTRPHRTRIEALSIVRDTLKMIETPEGKDIFFSKE